jgi:hypothetical protein
MKGAQPMTVAGEHDLLLRQVDQHVALGVGTPEIEELDLAVAPVQCHRPLEDDRGQRSGRGLL